MQTANQTLTTLSLGWGVQSFTLAALEAKRGCACDVCQRYAALFPTPIDLAIHSDTGFERQETYDFCNEWTPWLVENGVPVVTVSDKGAQFILKKSSTSEGYYTLMPVFTLDDTGKRGQLRRQCTSRWKIEPLHKWLGQELKRRGIAKRDGVVVQYLGISMDEWQRMKDSPVAWIRNVYPLIDLRMSRADCIRWLEAHDLPSPGKSACDQCPFHSRAYWIQMKRENGASWENAVKADEELRSTGKDWYLHSDRIPLVEAVKLPGEDGQMWMFDEDNEPTCDSGHCFV